VHLLATIIARGARRLSGATVHWVNCSPEFPQRVYFANHTSHLDFVVLWSILPKSARMKTRPAAAKDYWSSGLRKKLAVDVFNAILIERHSDDGQGEALEAAKQSLDLIASALNEGDSLIVFPEGTRGDGREIGHFKSGLYHLWQKRPDVQFVPVFIHNLNRILPKGEVLPVPVIANIFFGPPLLPEPAETKDSFLQKAREALCELSRHAIAH